MDNAHPTFEQHQAGIAVLSEFIERNPDSRELKRALAVKLALAGKPTLRLLSFWDSTNQVSALGSNDLLLRVGRASAGLSGFKSYLSVEQTAQVTTWLKTQYWNLDVSELDEHYGVVYQTELLRVVCGSELLEAIKGEPKHDAELVKTKREEIQDFCKHTRLKSRLGNLLCFR